MLTKADPIPKGFHTVTPYIVADDARAVVRFARQAFGAEHDHEPTMRPDGKIMHATLRIGSSRVMVANSSARAKATPVILYVYVPNVDAVFKMAEKAGGETIMQPADMFYGDRTGGVKDPAGNQWYIGTHIEDVSAEDLQLRANEMFKGVA
jgi:PhnB protein